MSKHLGVILLFLCLALGMFIGFLMGRMEPLGECIPGAHPPIELARCEDVQP